MLVRVHCVLQMLVFHAPMMDLSFVDAQGNPLVADSTRLAKVRLGNVIFKGKFIVSGVTTPLLSFGNVLRGGWSVSGLPRVTSGFHSS